VFDRRALPASGSRAHDPARTLARLSPIGILEQPDNDAARPRVYSRKIRLAALLLIAIFAAVVVVTTTLSLGAYCLTTDGAPKAAPASLPRAERGGSARSPQAR